MQYIFGTIDKKTKQIEALEHRWDVAINAGVMPIESLVIPDLTADCLLRRSGFDASRFEECMRCKHFNKDYAHMLFSDFYHLN